MDLKTKIRILKLKTTRYFWVDKNFKCWRAKDINDDYLKHIVYFIAEGKGWSYFTHNKKRINRIFKVAYRRKICRPDVLLILHSWTLYLHGYSDFPPRYNVDWEGNYHNSEFCL